MLELREATQTITSTNINRDGNIGQKSPNVLFITEPPQGWNEAVWPKSGDPGEVLEVPSGSFTLDNSRRIHIIQSDFHALAERRRELWEATVGRKPEDTYVTVVVPTHNEENNIESFIGNMSLFDIPEEANVHYLFVVNNSSDRSFDLTVDKLSILTNSQPKIEELTEEEIGMYRDVGLDGEVATFTKGNQRFMVMNTSTGSKANAMNIANRYALDNEHDVVVNLDANNYPEPTTVRQVIGISYNEVVDGDKFFVDAQPYLQKRRGQSHLRENILHRVVGISENHPRTFQRLSTHISGWCVAWNPEKLNIIGGVPPKGGDDYSLGVIARAVGYENVNIQSPARVWGNSPSIGDRIRGAARWHRERRQLLDFTEEHMPYISSKVKEIMTEEKDSMQPLHRRITTLIKNISQTPSKTPWLLAHFTMTQVSIFYGNYLYRKNPDNTSWDPLKSTK